MIRSHRNNSQYDMDKTYKITKILENGRQILLPRVFHNGYGAYENAVTLNMQLHGISNIMDPMLRLKWRSGVRFPKVLNPRSMAYIYFGKDVFCVSEIFESEMPYFSLIYQSFYELN